MNNGEFGEVKINDHFEKVFEDALKAKEAWLDMQTATKLRFHWSAPSPGYDNHFPLYRLGRLRYFASFSLQFETIFYGYASNKVWVSLKGFISLEMDTAEKCYNYVAPLMAKWLYADYSSVNHISSSDYTRLHIKFALKQSMMISDTSPTIQWRNLHLSLKDKLPFSFQLTLLNNGSIQFTYKIPSTKHNLHAQLPNTLMVSIGVSDSAELSKLADRRVLYGTIEVRSYTLQRLLL
ncbi:Hypothetical predicted protein [Cloeon dipterum]|uniref:Uncharacterized protein n=1 Tax=Cloeon dipterum TaxID=197152 RepID=A0A8S1E2S3_9INSE|nr:Hypothetical predicted protein [Cloeon dipterum]